MHRRDHGAGAQAAPGRPIRGRARQALTRAPESLRGRQHHAHEPSGPAERRSRSRDALPVVPRTSCARLAVLVVKDAGGAERPGLGVRVVRRADAAQPDLKGRVHAFLHAETGAQRVQWGTG